MNQRVYRSELKLHTTCGQNVDRVQHSAEQDSGTEWPNQVHVTAAVVVLSDRRGAGQDKRKKVGVRILYLADSRGLLQPSWLPPTHLYPFFDEEESSRPMDSDVVMTHYVEPPRPVFR
jgi:hypothetical protein